MNTIYYLDSSAWIKRYFDESGSRWISSLFAKGEVLASSFLGYVEVAAALSRQSHRQNVASANASGLHSVLDADWRGFLKLNLDEAVVGNAVALAWQVRLKGADAIHLAAANRLQMGLASHSTRMVFVTSDAELNAAARSIDIHVIDPAIADG